MSRESVEWIRRGWEIFENEGLDAWLNAFVAEDAQLIQRPSVAIVDLPRTRQGWDGWRASVVEWAGAFEEWEVDLLDIIDAGGEDVLAVWSDRGRGKLSGALVERPSGAFLHPVSQGKIVRTVQYGSADEALEAVGLRE